MSDTLIKVEHLHKKFCQSLKRSMFYGTMDAAKSIIGLPIENVDLRKNEFWALQGINFELKRGETLGLIGQNGCGKSTLLRLINGIFPPDKGRITINGRIGALIAVGAGFHPHMTGRENIFLNGTILGMSKAELTRKLDEIIEFAEIGSFIDAPVATYSSGMTVRLGFAIAINCEPDILLIDEILAVGDAKFQMKCLDKLRDLRKTGIAIIIVSHNMQNIEAISTNAILIDYGKQIMSGLPREVVPVYELLLKTGKIHLENSVEKMTQTDNSLPLVKKYHGFGTEDVEVQKFKLLNINNEPKLEFWSDDLLKIEITYNSLIEIDEAVAWFSFVYMNNYEGEEGNLVCLGTKEKITIKKGLNKLVFEFTKIQLTTGEYKIAFHIFDSTFTLPYSQGHYGYFVVKNENATQLRVSIGTPMCWTQSKIIEIGN